MVDLDSNAKSIFYEALDRASPDERSAYLDETCGDDSELRERVEKLLLAHRDAGNFLGGDSPVNGTIDHSPLVERPGTIIGPYKLLQQIGEGGFGVVFLAEQEQPVKRRVALKVIKPGMDTRQVIARFEAERQALALMDHPNIAKVYDAGTTDLGRPYFVMDVVKGVPITKYCDEHHLTPHQRLELFIPACQALQHAHQKGIIHRDLKPSNVMVALYDGRPVPKIIDFGVAKATGPKLTDRTMFTELGAVIGTFEYMSPEQAELNQLDVDTRSDVYSLGVLLYELLTGTTPLDRRRLNKSAMHEVLRLIREEEPPMPSTRISSAIDLPSVAANRGTEPARLSGVVRGELDWIVMKCLEKERNRRYDTPNSLARDIERYINDEPVQACPSSPAYRLRKFVRRNKLALAAGSSTLLALLIGLMVASIGFYRARTEAVRSEQVSRFLSEMLEGVGPNVALGRDTTLLREILDATARRVAIELKSQPSVEADLRNTIGAVYLEIGERKKAEEMHRQALAIRQKLYGDESLAVAESLNRLANVLQFENRFEEAEKYARQALAIRKRLLGNDDLTVADSLNNVAYGLTSTGKFVEAESMIREALAIQRKATDLNEHDVVQTLNNLARVLSRQQRLEDAEAALNDAIAIEKRLGGGIHPALALSLTNLSNVLRLQGKSEAADALKHEADTMQTKLFGLDRSN